MSLEVSENVRAGRGFAPSRVSDNVGRVRRELGLDTPTALRELPEVASRIGVARLFVKDESGRGTLGAFKILGASWASFRVLCEWFGRRSDDASVAEIARAARESTTTPTLVTATDGNHGRAVAHAARVFGVAAHITVPSGTSPGRIEAIEREGATCTVIDGGYDDAVAAAAAMADEDHIVVSDTSWKGYEAVPRWVTEGYDTIYAEIDAQLAEIGCAAPDAVVIPVGVGALAMAAVNHYGAGSAPTLIAVEPHGADCLARSIRRGESATALGPHQSMMVGLNCGTVSPIALPVLLGGIHWSLVVDDAPVADAMRVLAAAGVVSGETGAASLGGLIEWTHASPNCPVGADSVVVALSTEGATDLDSYHRAIELPR